MILLSQGITLINATLVLFQPVQFPRLGYICLPLGGGHYIGKERPLRWWGGWGESVSLEYLSTA